MNLEWLIPLRAFLWTLNIGYGLVIGNALVQSFEQGVGWLVATTLAGVVGGAIIIISGIWVDELIDREEINVGT